MIYFILVYLLFYIAGSEFVSKRTSRVVLNLLQSSYQSGLYLPLEKFNRANVGRESLLDFATIHSSTQRSPAYIKMLMQLHYDRVKKPDTEETRSSSIFFETNPLTSHYPFEFYEFLSQRWTVLGCEGVVYPDGFRIPMINKTLQTGTFENICLYAFNHHDVLKPFLSAPKSHITRDDNRNLFTATYAVAFVVETILDLFLVSFSNIGRIGVSILLFIVVAGVVFISKKIALFFFGNIIELNRYYRLKSQKSNSSNNSALVGLHYLCQLFLHVHYFVRVYLLLLVCLALVMTTQGIV